MKTEEKELNEKQALKIIYKTLENIIKERPNKPVYEFANRILCKVGKKRDDYVKDNTAVKTCSSRSSSESSDSSFEEEKERRVSEFPINTNLVMKQLWDHLGDSSSSGASSSCSSSSSSSSGDDLELKEQREKKKMHSKKEERKEKKRAKKEIKKKMRGEGRKEESEVRLGEGIEVVEGGCGAEGAAGGGEEGEIEI